MKKPKLGQHFLEDKFYLNKILDEVSKLNPSHIVEIGPGKGAMTDKLISIGQNYIGIEVDSILIKSLIDKYDKYKKVHFRQVDAGHYDPSNESSLKSFNYIVVGNLPYYAGNLIVRNFLTNATKPSHMIVMLQKEVAASYLATEPKMKFLSHSIQIYSSSDKITDVPKHAFNPPPKVESSVIRLTLKKSIDYGINNPEILIDFIKKGFSSPRKTLINSLSSNIEIDKQLIKNFMIENQLNEKIRPGELNLLNWTNLFHYLENFE